jgi:glycosyltransferase involved in cell wall biosynthesis
VTSDPRPTVVILDSSVAVTGGLRCAQRMAKLLAPWLRFVLVLPSAAHIDASELLPFAAVERLPLVQLRKSPSTIAAYGPALLASGVGLLRLLRKHQAQVLVINDFFQLQGWVARRLGWRGRLLTWVRFDPRRFPPPIARLWLAAAREASDEVVAVSRFIVGRLPADMKARRVYDCIDPKLGFGSQRGERRDDIVLLGNYIPGKGQDDAIEAFREVAACVPTARLLFHGGDMGLAKNRIYRASLQRRANELGLSERVLFHPFATDLPTALATARVALNLSRSESFSLTCLEAQQLRVPVISYRSGGPEEIIEDGETGHLVEVGDIAGVTAATVRLLEQPGLAERMGSAAARSVRERFGPEQFIAAVLPLLRGHAA